MALLADTEPVSFEEAITSSVWRDAMLAEIKSIEKNNTWELVSLPAEKTPIAVKWIFKIKLKPDGTIGKHLLLRTSCRRNDWITQRSLPQWLDLKQSDY